MQGTEKIVNAEFFWIWFHLRAGLRVLTKKNPWKKENNIFHDHIFDVTYCTDWLIIISNSHLISLSIIVSIYLLIYSISFVIYAELTSPGKKYLTSHMALCKIHKECWNFIFLACPLCLRSKVVTEVLWKFSSAGLVY